MATEQAPPIYWQQYISNNPQILTGRPAITGTRISVEQVIDAIAGGHSVEDIQRGLPHLSREQILACVHYAEKP